MFVLELFLISFLLSSYSIFGSEDPPPNSVALKVINAAGAPVSEYFMEMLICSILIFIFINIYVD